MSHTFRKQDPSSKNGLHLEKQIILGKWVTFGKMARTSKNWSQLEKCVTLRTMGDTQNTVSQLEKWVAVGKIGHTYENASHLEKAVTHLGNRIPVQKHFSHLEK